MKTGSWSESPNTTKIFFSCWGTVKHAVSQGSILGPLFFIICINACPLIINSISEPILFFNDTSVIISRRSLKDFCSVSNVVLSHMSKLFTANKLDLNFIKTNAGKILNKEFNTLYFTF